MANSVLAAVVIAAASIGTNVSEDDRAFQERVFQHFWGTEFEWKFAALPEKGGVPRVRLPYSGYIYPDTEGGTRRVLRKYDRAFHAGRSLAESHEKWDSSAFKEPVPRRGPLGLMTWGTRMGTPDWYGHCNGWVAASIRHAEPQRSVHHNGVVFTPADIKGLLAEIYVYNEHLDLSGSGKAVNPAMLHAVVTNWLGRGAHPLGMESDVTDEKWNYPAYAYNVGHARRTLSTIEVKMNLAYMMDSAEEYEESPRFRQMKSFHYLLTLDPRGQIIGGTYYKDSAQIEMLWLPLSPREAGEEGNEAGNPHVRTKDVLAMWRASVPEATRRQWPVADPAVEDRTEVAMDAEQLIPVGHRAAEAITARSTDTAETEPAARTAQLPRVTVGRGTVPARSAADPPARAVSPDAYWPEVHADE